MVYTNASSEFVVVFMVVASVASSAAHVAIANSFAHFTKVATTLACCAYLVVSFCLTCSCLCIVASLAASLLSASRFALRCRYFCMSSFVENNLIYPVISCVINCACFYVFGSCLSSIAVIFGVSMIKSRSQLPRELMASKTT